MTDRITMLPTKGAPDREAAAEFLMSVLRDREQQTSSRDAEKKAAPEPTPRAR